MKPLFACALLFISIAIVSGLPSCTKEIITTIVKTDTITINTKTTDTVKTVITDTLRTVFTDPSVMGRLTRKQWILDTVINNYSGPGTGTISYIRGSNSNSFNYDLVRSIYWVGGNSDSFNSNGTFYPYTWSLTNSDSTALLITNGNTVAYRAKILKLDNTHLNIYDSTDNTLDIQIYKP